MSKKPEKSFRSTWRSRLGYRIVIKSSQSAFVALAIGVAGATVFGTVALVVGALIMLEQQSANVVAPIGLVLVLVGVWTRKTVDLGFQECRLELEAALDEARGVVDAHKERLDKAIQAAKQRQDLSPEDRSNLKQIEVDLIKMEHLGPADVSRIFFAPPWRSPWVRKDDPADG